MAAFIIFFMYKYTEIKMQQQQKINNKRLYVSAAAHIGI